MLDEYLKNWSELQDIQDDLSEEQCKELLLLELAGKKRDQFVLRIYGRFNKLRTERERAQLLRGVWEI